MTEPKRRAPKRRAPAKRKQPAPSPPLEEPKAAPQAATLERPVARVEGNGQPEPATDVVLVRRRPYAIQRRLRPDDDDLRGPQGETGPQGEKGDQGSAVNIKGTLNDESDLPDPGQEGDAYLIGGDLYVWVVDSEEWQSVGAIQGPQGEVGPQGSQGVQGIQGIPGVPLQIHGILPAEGDLPVTGQPGDAWFVFPGTLWYWSVDERWELIGSLLGPQGDQGIQGVQGVPGQGVAAGGTAGQLLTKQSGTDYDTSWQTPLPSTPLGGTTDQVLGKTSNADHAMGWRSSALPRGGATNQLLGKTSATDWAASWRDPPAGTPTGGTTDQILGKTSNADHAVGWRSAGVPRGGANGQVLTKTAAGDWSLGWSTPAQTPNTAAPWTGYAWPNGSIYHDTNQGHGDTWLFFPNSPGSGVGPGGTVTLAVGDLVIYSASIMGAYRQYNSGGFALLRGPVRGPGATLDRYNIASNQLSGAYPNALTPFQCPLIGTWRWTAAGGVYYPGLAAWCVDCRLELHYWSIDVMIWRGLNVVSPASLEIGPLEVESAKAIDALDEKYPAALRKKLADEKYVLAHTWTLEGGEPVPPSAVKEGKSNGSKTT